MGSELCFPFFDNLSSGEAQYNSWSKNQGGVSFLLNHLVFDQCSFSFPLMTAEQLAKNVAGDQSSKLPSVNIPLQTAQCEHQYLFVQSA